MCQAAHAHASASRISTSACMHLRALRTGLLYRTGWPRILAVRGFMKTKSGSMSAITLLSGGLCSLLSLPRVSK